MIDERFVLLGGLSPLMAFAAQVSEGVGLAAVATFAVGFMPLTIFAASFVNAQSSWQTTVFDIICGVFSVVGLLLWAVTSDANLAIVFAIIADLLAAVPTIIKAWNRPKTESGTLFWLGIVNGAIGLLIVDSRRFENYAFIGYILLINMFLATLITFGPSVRQRASVERNSARP